MSLTFGICPCDTERNPEYWQNFTKILTNLFQKEFKPYTFKSFEQELTFLQEKEPDLYLASPDVAILLMEKDYIPLFRLAGEEDKLILVCLKNFRKGKKVFKVGLPELNFFYLGILLSSLPIENIDIVFVKCFKEGLEKLYNKEIDFLFLYERFFNDLPQNQKEFLKIEETISVPFYHFLMFKKAFYQKYKDFIDKIENIDHFEKASKEEVQRLNRILKKILFLSIFFRNKSILENLLDHPGLIIAAYQDRFIFSNKGGLEVTGYTLEEILNMSPLDLVYEEDRPLAEKILKRRLKGQKFPFFYPDLRIKHKSGKIIHLFCYTQTIHYNNKPTGLIIGIDITREKQLETFNKILKKINEIIIKSNQEKEIFENLCKTLTETFHLELTWIGKIEKEDPIITFIYSYGKEIDFPKKLCIPYLQNLKETHPALIALKKGEITINEYTPKFPFPEDFKEEMLKRNFLSCVAIPFFKYGKPYGVLSLISSVPYFFTEEIREILVEIQKDISFALEKIELQKEHQLLFHVIEQSKEWVVITDQNGTILYGSPFVSEISGYSPDEIRGKNPRIFKSGLHSQEFYKKLWDTILSGKTFSTVIINRTKDGSLFKLEEAIHPIKLPDGEIRFIAIGKDVTKEEYLIKEIEYFKFYDPLTGLYNFPTFSFKVNEKIAEDKNRLSALLLLDIQNLSWINYTYGVTGGDEVIKEVAKRLKSILSEKDIIGRAGGDEFALWIFDLPRIEIINKIVEKIKFSFQKPIIFENNFIKLEYNLGLVLYPRDGSSFEELYEKATLTLNTAKKENITFKFYNSELGKQFEKFIKTEEIIQKAFKKNLFIFYYQPYIELSNYKIAGVEALVRIKEDEKLYPPSEFIDYLENSPYLRLFEDWVLQKASEQIKKWNFNFSINISARTFFEENFIYRIKKLPKDNYPYLCLEITERTVIRDINKAKEILTILKDTENSIKIALDDFGTGYSSLIHLKELPVDIIKIDRSFISDMMFDKKVMSLVKGLIDLAHSFGIKVCAEGVETKEQLQALDIMGCDYAMGFYISKPLPEEEIERLLFSKERLKLL